MAIARLPVLRGAWVLEKLIGSPPTPPPPDTATDLSQKAGEQPKTVRARLEQHRANPTCRTCHGVIDPIGLALENFDTIGQWRTTDSQAKVPIDAGTVLTTGVADQRCRGSPIATGSAPRSVRTDRNGETTDVRRQPSISTISTCLRFVAIVRAAAKDNYKLSSIVVGIVNSDAFRKQGSEEK
jgi:hypothetical protein